MLGALAVVNRGLVFEDEKDADLTYVKRETKHISQDAKLLFLPH